jgi:predicted Zn-dependent protease
VLILRSGTERRRLERRERFLHTWQASDYWAAVLTVPDQPPATATGSGFIRALTAAERHLPPQSIAAGNAAALARWPTDPLVLLANGNQAYATGHFAEAITRYRSLLVIDPDHLGGRNNLANALLEAGCPQLAIQEARQASALVPSGSPLAAEVQDTLAKALAADAAGQASTCRAE